MRNKLRKGELVVSAGELARRTRSAVMKYMEVYLTEPKKIVVDKWAPPPE